MAPPHYGDLGKSARDIFGKGYQPGFFKLDLKTKTESGVQFNSELNFNQESGKVFGGTETKYQIKEHGITLTEKITTDNILASTLSIQDQMLKGLKISVNTSFAPQTGAKSGKLKTEFINDACALSMDMDVDCVRPLIGAAGVFKYQQWLAGCQMNFDTQKCSITKNNVALGYAGGDFSLHANVNDGQIFDTSIYHKVTPELDYGLSFNWTPSSNNTNFGIGCKYAMGEDTSLRAKVSNALQIGLGFQQKLRDGMTLTMSALVDGKNFDGGSHRFGIGLEIEP